MHSNKTYTSFNLHEYHLSHSYGGKVRLNTCSMKQDTRDTTENFCSLECRKFHEHIYWYYIHVYATHSKLSDHTITYSLDSGCSVTKWSYRHSMLSLQEKCTNPKRTDSHFLTDSNNSLHSTTQHTNHTTTLSLQ